MSLPHSLFLNSQISDIWFSFIIKGFIGEREFKSKFNSGFNQEQMNVYKQDILENIIYLFCICFVWTIIFWSIY